MIQFQTRTVSLCYDVKQDRLQWISHCEQGQQVSTWVTRRMLGSIMPRLAQWLDKYSEQQHSIASKAKTPAEKKSVHRFEHEAAQQQVTAVQEHRPSQDSIVTDFLLWGVQLSSTGSHSVKILLIDEQQSTGIVSLMSKNELHKVIGELMRLSDSANWKIENPWLNITREQHVKNDGLMH